MISAAVVFHWSEICRVLYGTVLDMSGLKQTLVPGHDRRPLTQARVVSVGLPEAQPAGGWWLLCSQPWSSPPVLLGRPAFALNEKQYPDVLLELQPSVEGKQTQNNSTLFW